MDESNFVVKTIFHACGSSEVLTENYFATWKEAEEFSRTRLKGLSFVDSDIRGIRVGDTGSFELKGLKVSALQASELARLLGLEIEE